jgi:predicted nuclease with RNAse H fold
VRVLGVDVSLGRGHDAVLLIEGAIKEGWSRLGSEAVASLLRAERPDAVAIDAPPSPGKGFLRFEEERARLSVPPAAGRHLNRRVAEYELSRRGIGSHQTHFDEERLFSWMTAGFELFAAVSKVGYPPYLGAGKPIGRALEVFPYASYVALAGCLSPARTWRVAWRRSILTEAGVQGLDEDASIDQVDAACAARTGRRVLEGQGTFVGDPREGVIVLPVSALADRYRRCPRPEQVPESLGSPNERLCACGCGSPVRRRFLPGHDARLKTRLVGQVRQGEAARRELERLGWSVGPRRETT